MYIAIQYNIIVHPSTTASNVADSLDVDSILVTKLDLGNSPVIGYFGHLYCQ